MEWKKSGNGYVVESDGNTIVYNLNGMVLKEEGYLQEQANKFLMINGYQPFEVDKPELVVEEKFDFDYSEE